jgi:hypothetical protein
VGISDVGSSDGAGVLEEDDGSVAVSVLSSPHAARLVARTSPVARAVRDLVRRAPERHREDVFAVVMVVRR